MVEHLPVVRIEQRTGPRRAMIFKGRSLPYQGLELGIEVRTKQTWMPSNPVSNQQVLGSMLPNTMLNGMWKDRYLAESGNGVTLINFPQISAGVNSAAVSTGGSFVTRESFPATQDATLSRVIVDALTLMAAEQQKVRFQWDQYVRYGLIKRFVPRWIRIADVEWSLEFEWSGVSEFSPVSRIVQYNALSTAAGLSQILSAILAAINAMLSLRRPNNFVTRIAFSITTLGALIVAVIESLRSIVSLATAPRDLLATLQGQLAQIRLAARALLNSLRSNRSARGEAALVGDPGDVARAALAEQGLRERLQEIAAFAREQQRLLELFTGQEILATFFADSFTSLRDVATRYYGQPGEWTRISNFNGFFSDTVPAGTLVRVPADG